MKIKITLKDPDGVFESIKDAAAASAFSTAGLDQEEMDSLKNSRMEKLKKQCSPWIEYGEYVTIEIDTEAGTANVCKAK